MSLPDYGPSWEFLEGKSTTTQFEIWVDLLKIAKHPKPYEVWASVVLKAVNYAVLELARDKNVYKGASENILTVAIVGILRTFTFDASFERNVGGNCDISVFGKGGMLWLAEAKIYKGNSNIFGGFRQLIDRYTSGLPMQDRGALLIYIFQDNAADKMKKWRDKLLARVKGVSSPQPAEGEIAFDTIVEHRIGRNVYTQHIPVVLDHSPTDILSSSLTGSGTKPLGAHR